MRKPLLSFAALTLVLAMAGGASAIPVVNPGFETGDFFGWTTIPAGSGSLFGVGGNPHTGNFAASFGGVTAGSFDMILQDLATTPGQSYTLRFWLANSGGPANSFQALWGGSTVVDVTNSASFDYTLFSTTVTATAATTQLKFQSYHLPAFYSLDDISVEGSVEEVAVAPEPSTLMTGGTAVLISLAYAWRRRGRRAT
jgi:hypothetical protein